MTALRVPSLTLGAPALWCYQSSTGAFLGSSADTEAAAAELTTQLTPWVTAALTTHGSAHNAEMPYRLISFGTLSGPPPEKVDWVVGLGRVASTPAVYRQILALQQHGPVDGRDRRIQKILLAEPVVQGIMHDAFARALSLGPDGALAISSEDGLDRSPAVVELLAEHLRAAGHAVVTEHRDIHRPRRDKSRPGT